jgi:WD40 repeat protein
MRQLIDSIAGGSGESFSRITVVGCGDEAYAIVVRIGDNEDRKNGGINDLDGAETILYRLVPPQPLSSKDRGPEPGSERSSSANEIQAVALHRMDDGNARCAVARYDKSLSIYHIPLVHGAKAVGTPLEPVHVHVSFKRISCLTFARVPPLLLKDVHSLDKSRDPRGLTVVIGGDLAGDAVAYSLEVSSTPAQSFVPQRTTEPKSCQPKTLAAPTTSELLPINAEDEGGQQSNNDATAGQRLLLGHTASMLTGVRLATFQDAHRSLILTADRDEKVRISCWPNTHEIVGYLLGHTAFVTDLDVAVAGSGDDGIGRCATVCGDGVIRLWNIRSHQLIASSEDFENSEQGTVHSVVVPDTTPGPRNEDNIMSEIGVNGSVSADRLVTIPTRVVLHSDGRTMAVLFDQSCQVEVWQLRPHGRLLPAKSRTLQMSNHTGSDCLVRIGRIECSSAPLDLIRTISHSHDQDDILRLLVITRDPTFLQGVQVELASRRDDGPDGENCVVRFWTPGEQHALQSVVSRERKSSAMMPQSILERDNRGNIKMHKLNELRGSSTARNKGEQPWNNATRREKARMRSKRHRNKKRGRAHLEGDSTDDERNGSTASDTAEGSDQSGGES